ncbi:hypothetical protein ACFQFQ_09975 [Sulfitobacter porphyrae]|uniref:Uncharacterized protein n=1 Tax=Sulfitobacter porphyrae TaxID=1246864 RepID=A0ABW2B3L2_9RHOB
MGVIDSGCGIRQFRPRSTRTSDLKGRSIMSSQSNAPLKTILLLDAATCLLMGLLLATASGFVCSITALPQTLLFCAGILLLPIGLFMAATAIWWPGSAAAVWLIIVGNAAG